VAAHDCGRIVNPLMVDSQVIGAVTQGIGFALTEERLVDMGRGVVMNANLENYLVPTMLDIPEIVNVHLDMPDPDANPTGAKGIGESPLIPTAPAIANAVFDAIGVRIRQTPLSRQRILTALAGHQVNGAAPRTPAMPLTPQPPLPGVEAGEPAQNRQSEGARR
jgi:CO/xanthine dehydrogenase Mo-binding subunit